MKLNFQSVAILGYGVEGQSLARFFVKNGVEFRVFDDFVQDIPQYAGKLGQDLQEFDVVFRSPAILPTRPELATARKVSSLTELFLELCPTVHTIGVTGTKGKGTTSTLITEILRASGKEVFLGGNIGVPPLDFLDALTEESWVVLELSSFQTMDLRHFPRYAVILMTTSEHLDVHSSTAEYVAAKANLAMGAQTVFYNDMYPSSVEIGGWAKIEKVAFCAEDVARYLPGVRPKLIGAHNLENIAAAMAVARALGVEENVQRGVIERFAGLPHRLEIVCEKEGVLYVNDSFSTTPETSMAALRAFPDRKIIWLAGGSPKGSDFSGFRSVVAEVHPKKIVLYGVEAERIAAALGENSMVVDLGPGVALATILEEAQREAKSGDVILLSPGCASFDLFPNYKARGEWFRNWALSL